MITESTRADIEAGSETYFVRGSVVVDPGYAAIYTYARSSDEEIPKLEEGQELALDGDPWILDKETQPPARLSQGKLVEMMEERGLGTKATRADIIQKLFDRGYVYSNPPIPSETGIAMYEAFKQYVPEMATPEMTARLEAEMDQIASGEMTRDDVVGDSRKLLHQTYEEIDGSREDFAKQIWAGMDEDKFLGPCKVCEEAGRKREDGGANRLRIIQLKGGKRMYGCEGWIKDDPESRTPARSAARFPAAAMTSGGWRSAARSAARCRASVSRASADVPGSSASTTTARRWSRCARSAPSARPPRPPRPRPKTGPTQTGPPRRPTERATARRTRRRSPEPPRRPAPDLRAPSAPRTQSGPRSARTESRVPGPGDQRLATGMFVSLEGIDGSGKSTQAGLLAEALGSDALLVREPGGTAAAERVRELLADGELELDPMAELLLFCAARADLVRRVIRPALEAGRDVVSDRFSDSTAAYQGGGRGLGIELAERLSEAAAEGLRPDLTVLLWIDPEQVAERVGGDDRFEAAGLELQLAVASAYEEIALRHPDRVVTVDASGSVEEVHARVMAEAQRRRS